jgi:hypothetical protein
MNRAFRLRLDLSLNPNASPGLLARRLLCADRLGPSGLMHRTTQMCARAAFCSHWQRWLPVTGALLGPTRRNANSIHRWQRLPV